MLFWEKPRVGFEAEKGHDPADLAGGDPVIQLFPEGLLADIVHEHDAIHELDAVFAAGGEHGFQFARTGRAGFFTQDVLAGPGGADHPFRPQTGGDGNVHGIHVGRRQQGFVTAQGPGRNGQGRGVLAFRDVLRAAGGVAAGHGREHAVFRPLNRLPVFAAAARRAQKAPTQWFHLLAG